VADPVRALVDANVLISFLLRPDASTAASAVVSAALTRTFVILTTGGVLAETRERTQQKPYLAQRISRAATDRFVRVLLGVADLLPEVDPPYPEIGSDRKDDYLFVHAITGRADYLVSGDRGVLAVGTIGPVRVVSPATFMDVLSRFEG
jgi:uncharacterized protein